MAERNTVWKWGNQQKYHTEIQEELDKKLDDFNVITEGNSVVLDGLQDKVPFSEIVVSGKNMFNTGGGVEVRCTAVVSGNTLTLTPTVLDGTASAYYYVPVPLKKGQTVTISGSFENSGENTIQLGALKAPELSTSFVKGEETTAASGNILLSYTPDNDYPTTALSLYARVNNGTSAGSVVYSNIQVEYNSEAMEYVPPITGQELTVTACGKNLMPYPYTEPTKIHNGITFTDNGDGSVTANGTATGTALFTFMSSKLLPKGTYTISGGADNGTITSYKLTVYDNDKSNMPTIVNDFGSGATFTLNEPTHVIIRAVIFSNITINNIIFKPMLEYGSTATAYEPYSGADYTITPDSNLYTVPTEIYQQDGINTVYVTGEGEPTLSVKGVKENAALAKLWSEKMNTDDAQSTYVQKSGDTMEGVLVAQSNMAYTTAQVRNITMSTETASGGSNGQIHFQYT